METDREVKDPCLYVIECSWSGGYLPCVLPGGHTGAHRPAAHYRGDEKQGAEWISLEQLGEAVPPS